MTLKGFNENTKQVLGSIYPLFEIDGRKSKVKFQIIDVGMFYNVLLDKP